VVPHDDDSILSVGMAFLPTDVGPFWMTVVEWNESMLLRSAKNKCSDTETAE
jgi:hypothetical protein